MVQKSTSEGGQSTSSSSSDQSVQSVARDLKGEITGVAKDVAGEAKKAAESKANAGKDFAVEHLESIGDALHKTSKHLRTTESPAGEYVEKAAASVDKVARYFQTRTLSELIEDVQSYGRREPAVFLGGALFLGMLGGRLLKAATPSPSSASRESGARMASAYGEQRTTQGSQAGASARSTTPGMPPSPKPGDGANRADKGSGAHG